MTTDSGVGGWWRRRSRGAKAALVLLFIVVVVLVGLVVVLGGSPAVDPTGDPVSAQARVQNTHLTNTLGAADVDASLVDVTDERVYVAYSLPAFAYDETGAVDTATATELQRFVVGAAADTAPGTDRLVVVQYDDETPLVLWEVRMTDFDAFVAGELSLAAFEERIRVQRYT